MLMPAVLDRNGAVQPIALPQTNDRHSCIWDPRPEGEPFNGKVVGTFTSRHTFGHPLMFKPSLAEVRGAAPDALSDGFFTIACDMTGPEAAAVGAHLATVTVWADR